MKITINGESAETECETLAALLLFMGYENRSVATAVNQEFIPLTERQTCVLKPTDRVEIIAPMSGG